MKYRLINQITKEEIICDKVTVHGFDYYLGDVVTDIETSNVWYTNCDSKFDPFLKFIGTTFYAIEEFEKGNFRKLISTNNPNIDIPKIVDKVEEIVDYSQRLAVSLYNPEYHRNESVKSLLSVACQSGYSKSQETHPFTEDDVCQFVEWMNLHYRALEHTISSKGVNGTKGLLNLWKEEQIKTIYYE